MDKEFETPIVLDERYFGETPAIKELFSIYSRFRQKYINFTGINLGVNKDKDLIEFCNKASELWGFKSMSYIIIQSPAVNSFTLGIDLGAELPTNIETMVEYGPNGIRFKEKCKVNVLIAVYTGLFLNPVYTDRECFAVFLHEVGHNFQCAMNKSAAIAPYIRYPYIIINAYSDLLKILSGELEGITQLSALLLSATNGGIGAVNKVMMTIKTNPVLGPIYDFISLISKVPSIIDSIKNLLLKPINYPIAALRTLINAISAPLVVLVGVFRYSNEQIADSFAADLGYGKDLATWLMKMERNGNSSIDLYNQIPIVNAIVNLWCLPFLLILHTFDEHPIAGARIKGNIDIMTNDLEKGYVDPKMRKAMERDLRDTKAAVAEFEAQTKSLSLKNKQIFSQLFLLMTIDQFEGGIKYKMIKSVFNQSEEREQAYQRVKKMNEGYSFLDDVVIK